MCVFSCLFLLFCASIFRLNVKSNIFYKLLAIYSSHIFIHHCLCVSLIFATQYTLQSEMDEWREAKKQKIYRRDATSTWFHLHSWFWLLMLSAFSTKANGITIKQSFGTLKCKKLSRKKKQKQEKTTFGKHHAKIIKWRFAVETCVRVV